MAEKIKTLHITSAPQSLDVFLKSRLEILEAHNFKSIGCSYYDNSLKNFADSGFDIIPLLHMTRSFNLIEDIKLFFETYRIVKKEKPVIVHTYGVKPGLYSRLAARLAGAPIVVHTLWGFLFVEDSPWYKKLPFILEEKLAAGFCDYIFSVNNDDLKIMNQYSFKKTKKIGYLGNATDISSQFNPKNYSSDQIISAKVKMGLNPKSLVIGKIGRLTKSKGYVEFFKAIKLIKDKYPEIEVIVVGRFDNTKGGGIDRKEIANLEKENIIKYLGVKNHDDMPLTYAICDIIVLMSHREGFPRSLVEAGAMGKPIIASDIRGCREAVEPGVNGILVPLRDHKKLAEALDRLISDQDLRNQMGTKSRLKAERDYDEEKLVGKILTVYDNLLQEKKIIKTN